jgi:glycine dehydrogenase subunit 1
MYVTRSRREREEMLKAVGVGTVDELLEQVPADLLRDKSLDLPPPMSELELTSHMKDLAASNTGAVKTGPFVGGGAYDHYVPSAVKHIVSRAEFLTAYTPYQPEVSQGTLQGAYEYQSMVCALTGLEVSNASLYDGASGAAEAVLMARAITDRPDVVVGGTLLPPYRRVLSTYLKHAGAEIKEALAEGGRVRSDEWKNLVTPRTAAVVIQTPNMFGMVEDVAPAVEAAKRAGALTVLVCDLLSLALLRSPGEWGADIAVGEGQPAGSSLNYGGPYLGFIATRRSFIRKMPGRIIAETVDAEGRRGFVMTLQTREQHIRRERATSNICTNQGLNALAAAVHMGLLGPDGLRKAAEACVRNAWYAARELSSLPGFKLKFEGPFFREFVLETPVPPSDINRKLADRGMVGGLDLGRWDGSLDGLWLICVTEKRRKAEIDSFVSAVREICE